MGKKLTLESFIIDCNIIHHNKYDYSLSEYINNKTNIKIICPIHGIFEQRGDHHKSGRGCKKCAIDSNNFYDKNRIYSYKRMSIEEFIRLSNIAHNNKYDYSLSVYKNAKTKIEIICPIHGSFNQLPNNHKDKKVGCPKCANDEFSNNRKLDSGVILSRLDTTNYVFDIDDYKNVSTKIKVFCKKHETYFEQYPKHLFNGILGCIKCNNSIGEVRISNYLTENNIFFETQKTFNGCKLDKLLRFDFYLRDYNICIEFDGEQHFRVIEYFGGLESFKKIQCRDSIKNDFCNRSGIKLLRISYNDINSIDNILNNYFIYNNK
jgi:very-short-patch-repair endonuclease